MTGYEMRMPYLVERYREFSLAVGNTLAPPYVILWIFDWLPYVDIHSRREKIRWLEQIARTMRLLTERHTEQRVTRSFVRRLKTNPER